MKFLLFICLFQLSEIACSQPRPTDYKYRSDVEAFETADLDGTFAPIALHVQPMFPGGTDSLRNWFQHNVRFPESVDTLVFENDIY
ncbi:MAG: hypothetical protein LBR65_02475, partial [Culturomica sp.]|nr:hypothetical protein [Culturomica sp.]